MNMFVCLFVCLFVTGKLGSPTIYPHIYNLYFESAWCRKYIGIPIRSQYPYVEIIISHFTSTMVQAEIKAENK